MTINYNNAIKSLRDIVWGVVTDPLSQIEQITLLIFIKLLSERHNELERLKAKRLIFTGEYASYHFDSLSRLSGYELVDTTRKAIESLYKNPDIDEPIRRLYERSYLQVNDPRVLSLLINEINKLDIAHIDMGDFYEHLLAVLGTQKEAGQFRTPRHLIEFIVDIVDPQIGERVLDPACGTAGFLTAAYTHLRDTNTSQEARKTDTYLDKLNFDQKTFLLNKTIFGFDIDPKMIKFAISNLYLHNIKNPNISQHNTLTSNNSWEEKYEVILTNPPFSTPKGGVKPTDRFTLDSKRTEVLFAEYVIEHLTLNGRAGVIVPEGIIFQSGKAYKELRKWLVENNYLYAVVSLPSGVFNPYSGVKTSILFIDRERAQRSDKILFCKVDNDGFDLGAQRRPIDKNDLTEVLRVVKEYKTDPNKPIDSILAYFVTKDKIIQSGDYNLTGDRYKETIDNTNQKWPMVELKEISVVDWGNTKLTKSVYKDKGGYLGVSAAGCDGRMDKFEHEIGVTVLSAIGANCGVVFYPSEKFTAIKNTITFIPIKEKILPRFLFLVMSNNTLPRRGGGQPFMTKGDVQRYKIPLPPLPVQQQIVDELDGYQKIINGAKQVVDNYKPQINEDPSWELVKLENVCEYEGGTQPPKSTFRPTPQNGFIRLLQIRDYKSNENAVYIPISARHKKCNESDIMIGRYGPPVFQILRGKSGAYNVALMKCIPNKERLLTDWLYYFLKSDPVQKKIIGLSTRVRQSGVRPDDLNELIIPLPSIDIQNKVIEQVKEEQKLVEANKKLIQLFEQKIKDRIEEVWRE